MPKQSPEIGSLTVMFCDHGAFVEQAAVAARSFAKVYLWVASYSGSIKITKDLIGYGLEGVELVDDIFQIPTEEIDLYVFPDVGMGWLATELRALGKPVWAAGQGDIMELDRAWMKERMKKLGLPVGPWERVKGVDALREFLKKHNDQYIKVSRYRDVSETFHAPNYRFVENDLDDLAHELGGFKNIVEFIVESALPNKIEIGNDSYSIDGQFPSVSLSGLEIKDCGYVGIFKPRTELPPSILKFEKAIGPTMKDLGYRGYFSEEMRIGKDQVGYMIDATARAPSPPSELYSEFYLNLPMVWWQGANGVLIDPKPIAKFGAQAIIYSHHASRHWMPVDVPEEVKQYVKLKNAAFVDGRWYSIPQHDDLGQIGGVIGFGDTLDEAIAMVRDIAEKIKGPNFEIKVAAFDEAEKLIEEADEYGVKTL